MRYSDFALPRPKIITIRYRDKYVDLVSDTDHYGTMTQNTAGDRIEFDFSGCRVIGVRDAWLPVIVDKNAPEEGVIITREQLQEAAEKVRLLEQ